MRHPETGSARIIMRREKTMRVGKKGEIIITLDAPQMCANHSILPWMDLRPNCGSQKVRNAHWPKNVACKMLAFYVLIFCLSVV